MVLEPGLAEAAGVLGLDDPLAVGVQLDVVADAAAERAGRVLHDRQAHPSLASPVRRSRPDRAGRRTFSQAPGRGSCRGCGAACTARPRSCSQAGASLRRRLRPEVVGVRRASSGSLAIVRLPWILPLADTVTTPAPAPPDAIGSTSTSQPLEVGIPVPSVSAPMSRQVGGPYGTKIMPAGTFPSTHWKVASPFSDRTRTLPPGRDADLLHVLGVHGQGAHDRLVLGVVLADVDLLALLGRAARVHDEALAHRFSLRMRLERARGSSMPPATP